MGTSFIAYVAGDHGVTGRTGTGVAHDIDRPAGIVESTHHGDFFVSEKESFSAARVQAADITGSAEDVSRSSSVAGPTLTTFVSLVPTTPLN